MHGSTVRRRRHCADATERENNDDRRGVAVVSFSLSLFIVALSHIFLQDRTDSHVAMAAPVKKRDIQQKLGNDEDHISSSSEDEEYEIANEEVRDGSAMSTSDVTIERLTSLSEHAVAFSCRSLIYFVARSFHSKRKRAIF